MQVKELEKYSKKLRVLYVEDEDAVRFEMADYLSDFFGQVETAKNGLEGLNKYRADTHDIVISDIKMPVMNGIDMVKEIKKLNNGQYIIVISAYSESEYLIQLINEGIYRFILKPIDHRVLLNLLFQVCLNVSKEKGLIQHKLKCDDVAADRKTLPLPFEAEMDKSEKINNIIGTSIAVQKMYAFVQILAGVKSTVLISGESGVGKELIAEAIHYDKEENKRRPFVKVNCASLPDELLESELFGHVKGAFTGAIKDRIGRFQMADGGTIFLDEIGDISNNMQLRLLRVLQEMEFERVGDSVPVKVDVRVITATNKDLLEKVKRGTFRNDLYYRLKVVEIKVPPLRDRRQDIPLLAHHFLDKLNRQYHKKITAISREVLSVFGEYDWPGNVRELKHAMENGYVLCNQSTITLKDLPDDFYKGKSANSIRDKQDKDLDERETIVQALAQTGWNKAKAARLLNIDRKTLYLKMAKYNISNT